MGEICSRRREDGSEYKILAGKPERKGSVGTSTVVGRIIDC
jgi:hypothetical protein